MNCQNCGHPKSSHIYEEGACRPGFACSCEKFVPEVDQWSCVKGSELLRHEFQGNSRICVHCSEFVPDPEEETPEIIPLKSMDPDVAEVLGRICERLGIVHPGTFIGDELAIVTTVLELRKDLEWTMEKLGRCLCSSSEEEWNRFQAIRKKVPRL